MNLYKSEIHRLLRRRLTWIFGIIAVAGLVLVTLLVWLNTGRPNAEEVEFAEQLAADQRAELESCKTDEEYFEREYGWDLSEDQPELSHAEMCEQELGWGTDPADHYTVQVFRFDQDGMFAVIGVGVVVGLLAMMLASTAIGAEWSSGNLANLLLWHPNRMKVWFAKLGAPLAVCAAATLALMAMTFGLLYMVAAVAGDTGTLDSAWWGDSLPQFTRTFVLALGMTMFGASLAMLGRHTAIAGGVIAGYLVIGNQLLVGLASLLSIHYAERFSLYTWVGAWITGRIELYDWLSQIPETMIIDATEAGLLLGGIVFGFAGLATWAFAKRDVT